MNSLPAAFAGLRDYRQFVVFQLAQRSSGKLDKFPVDPNTLLPVSAHDPRGWLTADDAIGMASVLGPSFGVGFVFTSQDPFWFLDIDHCYDPQTRQLSPLAQQMVQGFAGAAVEISSSGTGLHIIGSGTPPPHRTTWRSDAGKLEFYHDGRFVALTGTGAQGDVRADFSAFLPNFAAYYFPPIGDQDAASWNDTADPDWAGPADDQELVSRALRSTSAASRFGTRASFKDLWECNVDVLQRAYPDPSGDRQYDASAADAALAQHLAFWTGKNHERILQVMRLSALRRDKWDRPDYLPRTIQVAVSMQKDVYKESGSPQQAQQPSQPAQSGTLPENVRTGVQFMAISQQLQHFYGCCYVRDLDRVFVPDGALLKPSQFNAMYGGYMFSLDAANTKTTKKAWEVFTESQATTFPRVANVCFRPSLPAGYILNHEGRQMLNIYVPIETEAEPGDCAPFWEFFAKLLPDERDREILWSYMAAIVQYPGYKFQWWPFIQGVEGNGKTMLFRIVEQAIGQRYTHYPKASQLAGQFNGWAFGKLFIGVEEIFVAEKVEITEALKPLVTNERLEIEAKGRDQVTLDNFANGMLASNYKNGMTIRIDTRRYAPFFTAQQSKEDLARDGMTHGYFPKLRQWLLNGGFRYLTHALKTYQIREEFNPATYLVVAPSTSSTAESVVASRTRAEQEIAEAIESGRPGFCGGWVSSLALQRLLETSHITRGIAPNQRGIMMRNLGYFHHPAMAATNGRASSVILAENGRPVLYALPGTAADAYDATTATTRYCEAQNYAT